MRMAEAFGVTIKVAAVASRKIFAVVNRGVVFMGYGFRWYLVLSQLEHGCVQAVKLGAGPKKTTGHTFLRVFSFPERAIL